MKKTIQRVLAAVILFAMILSGGFSEVGTDPYFRICATV